MARALPIREIFVPFLLFTAALLAACASAPPEPAVVDPPAPPSGLTAVLHPGGPLVLEWRDNSPDETSFVVVEDCGETRSSIGSVGRDQTRVVVEGAPGATCSFVVFAANGGGLSAPSNVATIGMAAVEVPPDAGIRDAT